MKEFYLNKAMYFIEKNSSNFDEKNRNIIKYGLESFYLSVTKIIPILIIAFLIGIIKETLIFLFLYNILRFFAFGIHASKSYLCFISSLLIFLIIPYLCTILTFNLNLKIVVSVLSLISFILYSPADTHKKPIINNNKRIVLKIISTSILIIYIVLIFLINNNFYINILILSMITESIMINKYVYKLFGLPYDNYKRYVKAV